MKFLVEYALKFVGINYLWGGNNAIQGFDCSGLVQEILACVGMDPQGRDTAQSLFDHFSHQGIGLSSPMPGALAFYGPTPQSVKHVGFCINEHLMVEAGGGGSSTTSPQAAAKASAVVRIRPIGRRSDLLAVYLPSYPAWVVKDL